MARTVRGLLTVVLIAALAGVIAPAAPAATSRCKRPAKAKVVVASRLSVVYSRVEQSLSETFYWACLKSNGKRFRLTTGSFDDVGGIEVRNLRFRVRGRYLVYATESTDTHAGTRFVSMRVFDVRSRRLRRKFDVASPVNGGGDQFPYVLNDVGLTTRGHVVWSDSGQANDSALSEDRIGVVDVVGSRIVAKAPLGTITELTLKKNVATWKQSGVAHSFTLQQQP
jgi:hypothetical protein